MLQNTQHTKLRIIEPQNVGEDPQNKVIYYPVGLLGTFYHLLTGCCLLSVYSYLILGQVTFNLVISLLIRTEPPI